jgi:hypothetical protein
MASAFELPPKPPRMRWATYRRLEAQYEELQNRWIVGALGRFERAILLSIAARLSYIVRIGDIASRASPAERTSDLLPP